MKPTSSFIAHFKWILQDALTNELFYGCIIIGLALLPVMPAEGYLFTIAESLAFHYAIGLGVLLLTGLALRKWYFAGSLVIGLILLILALRPGIPLQNAYATTSNKEDLKVTHLNVLTCNYDYQATMDHILKTEPDLISIQEVNHRWAKKLTARMDSTYPYSTVIPRSDSFGIAVFAKKPLKNVEVQHWGDLPNITGQVEVDGQKVHFVTSHVPSPLRLEQINQSQTMMRQLRQHIKNQPFPKLVIGDLNTVSWGRDLQRLTDAGQLTDSRTSYAATYPAWLGFAGIPIDYILYSKGLACRDFNTFSSPSDHRGINGKYQITEMKGQVNERTQL